MPIALTLEYDSEHAVRLRGAFFTAMTTLPLPQRLVPELLEMVLAYAVYPRAIALLVTDGPHPNGGYSIRRVTLPPCCFDADRQLCALNFFFILRVFLVHCTAKPAAKPNSSTIAQLPPPLFSAWCVYRMCVWVCDRPNKFFFRRLTRIRGSHELRHRTVISRRVDSDGLVCSGVTILTSSTVGSRRLVVTKKHLRGEQNNSPVLQQNKNGIIRKIAYDNLVLSQMHSCLGVRVKKMQRYQCE